MAYEYTLYIARFSRIIIAHLRVSSVQYIRYIHRGAGVKCKGKASQATNYSGTSVIRPYNVCIPISAHGVHIGTASTKKRTVLPVLGHYNNSQIPRLDVAVLVYRKTAYIVAKQ